MEATLLELIKKENQLKKLQEDYDNELKEFNSKINKPMTPQDYNRLNNNLTNKSIPLKNKETEIKTFLRTSNANKDIINSYFSNANVLSDFKGDSSSRIKNLRNLLPRGRETPRPQEWTLDGDSETDGRKLPEQPPDERSMGFNHEEPFHDVPNERGTVKPMNQKSTAELQNERNNLIDKLKNDPNNAEIKNQIGDIDKRQDELTSELENKLNDKTLGNPDERGMMGLENKLGELRRERMGKGSETEDEDVGNYDTAEEEDDELTVQDEDVNIDNQSGEPTISPHEVVDDKAHPDDFESQITESIDAEDNEIYGGKENTPNVSLFREMIHSASELGFQYLETQIPELKLIKELLPIELRDVMENAMDVVENKTVNDIGNLKAPSGRMKLRPMNSKGEHAIVTNAVLYPFLVMALNFYMSKNEMTLLKFNWVMKTSIQFLLDSYLKLDHQKSTYLMSVYNAYPNELNEAFVNNSNEINEVTLEQREKINEYMKFCIEEYNVTFRPNTYMKDVRKYENGGTSLISLFKSLSNPKTLFEINQMFNGVDTFIMNVSENKDLLLGLMGLVYNVAREEGELKGDSILGNGMIDGIVYYKKRNSVKFLKKDIDLEIMKNMSVSKDKRRLEGYDIVFNDEKIAQYNDKNGNSFIVFRGTDLKEKGSFNKDFMKNILNLSGSPELFNNREYNRRYLIGTKLAQTKMREIQNTGKGSLKILGYSFGSIFALHLSYLYPLTKVKIFNPVISNSDYSKGFMKALSQRRPNLEINAIEEDPISINLKQYSKMFKINYRKKSKYFNSHSLDNYNY